MHVRGVDGVGARDNAVLVIQVWVARPLLGLSSTVGAENMMLGEVMREFKHVITGTIMYKVDFGGVVGTHAIAKDSCQFAWERDIVGAFEQAGNPLNAYSQGPNEGNTFTLDLPSYLEDGATDSDSGR